jgi:predicted nucleotidyltransferase component of viral defense system
MIPDVEIKEQALEHGVPASTIERDYAQNWLLGSLGARFEMALKGGTGIRKVFIGDYRFSDDLDFTLLREYGLEDVRVGLGEAVRDAGVRSGISFLDDVAVKEVSNGFEGVVRFRILRSAGNPLRIKLDLTKFDGEVVVLSPESRRINHHYSDGFSSSVLSYPFDELFSEKIRALFERTRPRDLYDVWRLKGIGLDVSRIVVRKFDFKRVVFYLEGLDRRRGFFEGAWNTSLEHQLPDLPSFEAVFRDVMDFLVALEYLFK